MLTSEQILMTRYGYLGKHLLKIVNGSGGYEFLTKDPSFVEKYNFKKEQSPYTGAVYYVFPAPENTGISAYYKQIGVKYRGHTFTIDGGPMMTTI